MSGLMATKLGIEYILRSRNNKSGEPGTTLGKLFTPSVFEGSGIHSLAPFTGYAYLNVAGANILAARFFGSKEAALTLLAHGCFFHFGMGHARLNIVPRDRYLPGAAKKTSTTQFVVGLLCTASAAATLLEK
jgi:hypothetical protein